MENIIFNQGVELSQKNVDTQNDMENQENIDKHVQEKIKKVVLREENIK
jgi:hypothetical protein